MIRTPLHGALPIPGVKSAASSCAVPCHARGVAVGRVRVSRGHGNFVPSPAGTCLNRHFLVIPSHETSRPAMIAKADLPPCQHYAPRQQLINCMQYRIPVSFMMFRHKTHALRLGSLSIYDVGRYICPSSQRTVLHSTLKEADSRSKSMQGPAR